MLITKEETTAAPPLRQPQDIDCAAPAPPGQILCTKAVEKRRRCAIGGERGARPGTSEHMHFPDAALDFVAAHFGLDQNDFPDRRQIIQGSSPFWYEFFVRFRSPLPRELIEQEFLHRFRRCALLNIRTLCSR